MKFQAFEQIMPFKDIIFTMSICTVRMAAILSIAPFISQNFVQGTARNAVVLALTVILVPMVLPSLPPDGLTTVQLLKIVVKEAILGVFLGFIAAMPFWLAQSIGFMVDNQRGSSMASIFDPMAGEETSPLGSMMTKVATVLFFTTGAFLTFLDIIYDTYRIWPVFSFFPQYNAGFPGFFLSIVDRLSSLTLLIAAPMIFVMFLTDLGLGMMNRFAPQLNVFFLSMPIKSALGIFIFIIYFGLVLNFMEEDFLHTNDLLIFLRSMIMP
ncbi:EscT/YscT/HrcT family type III secretion system export apparatus protein [Verrucomicrobia bacterium LW23]|nr:EscT/YscT/HrcT family type III secretion system export apparatus protein [Verrucomicrobia bacterium LW23]